MIWDVIMSIMTSLYWKLPPSLAVDTDETEGAMCRRIIWPVGIPLENEHVLIACLAFVDIS